MNPYLSYHPCKSASYNLFSCARRQLVHLVSGVMTVRLDFSGTDSSIWPEKLVRVTQTGLSYSFPISLACVALGYMPISLEKVKVVLTRKSKKEINLTSLWLKCLKGMIDYHIREKVLSVCSSFLGFQNRECSAEMRVKLNPNTEYFLILKHWRNWDLLGECLAMT